MQRLHFGLLSVFALFISLSGCGGALESQVSGTVTLDGKPLDKGSIIFHPAETGVPAYGSIDAEGHYSVKSGQGQGMNPGEYIVVVQVTEEVQPSTDPGEAERVPKLLSPKKYALKQTSPLKFTVTAGEQIIDVPLESD